MFDIIGFWAAATVFCVPPTLFILWMGLSIANHQVKVESYGSLSIPFHKKVCNKFGDDNTTLTLFFFSIPALILWVTYLCETHIKDKSYNLVQWVSHCSESWSGFFGWVFSILAIFVAIKLLAKFYAKFVILSEKVKTL